MLENRCLLIATQHKKEEVLAPLFRQAFDMKPIVNSRFNTDTLGTFSGEVERKLDPLANARLKAQKALTHYPECDLVVSSEGSFGQHPLYPFRTVNEEIVFFYDQKNNLECFAKFLALDHNALSRHIQSLRELEQFGKDMSFPSHSIILKATRGRETKSVTGINNERELRSCFQKLQDLGYSISAESDMRANHNPTRMENIKTCGENVIKKLQKKCPKCHWPGFHESQRVLGLPCSQCHSPTKSTRYIIYQCQNCQFQENQKPLHGLQYEDPTFCDFCNP